MNLLHALAPPLDVRLAHARLGYALPKSLHTLLDAKAEVWEPGDEPEPPKVAKPRKINPNPSRKLDTIRAQVLLALNDSPQTYHDVAKATGLPNHQVKECLSQLTYRNLAKNIAPSGSLGLYVLMPVELPKVNRGVFDV